MKKIFRRTFAAIFLVACVFSVSVVGAATPQEEIQRYTQEIQINPNNAAAYFKRGIAYYDLRQHERAIQDYNKAIQINPNLAEVYNNRGIAYRALGDEAKAQADFAKAKQLGYTG